MLATLLETILETFLTNAGALKIATLLTLAAMASAALVLAHRHKREKEEMAADDDRNRGLFRTGASDSAGDRTAELIAEFRQRNESRSS